MGLPIAAWFTGDDGPPMSDRPRELPTPPRTLPVTPAERACATVLRAYLAWNIDEANDPEGTFEWWSMVKLGEYLETRGFVEPSGHDPSQVGRALLARVEAEPTAPPRSDAYDQAVRDVCAMLRAEHGAGSVGSFDFVARCIESQFKVTPPAAPPLPPVPLLSDDAIKSPTAALLWFADEGHYEGTYRKGAGFADACGMSIARRALGLQVDRPDNTLMPLSEALAARRAAAPPAKEPR